MPREPRVRALRRFSDVLVVEQVDLRRLESFGGIVGSRRVGAGHRDVGQVGEYAEHFFDV